MWRRGGGGEVEEGRGGPANMDSHAGPHVRSPPRRQNRLVRKHRREREAEPVHLNPLCSGSGRLREHHPKEPPGRSDSALPCDLAVTCSPFSLTPPHGSLSMCSGMWRAVSHASAHERSRPGPQGDRNSTLGGTSGAGMYAAGKPSRGE